MVMWKEKLRRIRVLVAFVYPSMESYMSYIQI